MAAHGWRDDAACKGMATDAFFISKDALHTPTWIRDICDSCPVRRQCLLEALVEKEEGVWGGTTEKQRRALRRHYRRASCPSCSSEAVPTMDDRQVCVGCGMSWLAHKVRTVNGVRVLEKDQVPQ